MVFPPMRERLWALVAHGVCVVTSVALVTVAGAAPSADVKCVQAKSKAAARRLSCLAKEESKLILRGLPANVAKCQLAFDRSILLAEAAAAGSCPVTGDGPLVAQRVDDAASAIRAALQATVAASPSERRCAAAKNLAAAKYGECTSTMLRQRLAGKKDVGGDFARCPGKLSSSFAAAEKKGGCLTIGDAAAIAPLAGPVGMNLAQVALSGTDLRGAILVGADLAAAALSQVDLSNADLRSATLAGATLHGVDLGAATLAGTDLSNAGITDADFHGADLSGASLVGATLLGDVDLGNSDLSGASFLGATLQADLTGANPSGATFAGATLTATRAVKLTACPAALPTPWVCLVVNAVSGYTLAGPGALLSSEDLSNGNFSNLDLHGAVLSGDLAGATFANANLAGASIGIGGGGTDFSGANLAGAGIGGNHAGDLFVGADLAGADLTTGLFADGDFSDADLTGADLDGTYLVGADLAGADLTNATLSRPCVAWSGCGVYAVDLDACPASLPAGFACVKRNLLGRYVQAVQADLAGADLSALDLTGADLWGADLDGADLTDADVSGARFLLATMNAANFTGTDAADADFVDAQMLGVTWASTTCPDHSGSATNGSSPESCCAHLDGAPMSCSP